MDNVIEVHPDTNIDAEEIGDMVFPLNLRHDLRVFIISLLTWSLLAAFLGAAESTPLVICDDAPAGSWDVGYPVGNGRLGATVNRKAHG